MANVHIIALPFAGGNEYSYERFKQYLPANFVLCQINLPGRGERLDEDFVPDIVKLAKDAFQQIEKTIRTQKYFIYGHSMGTLLGYELTKEILKQNCPPPSCLFFTGRGAPCYGEEEKITSYPKGDFWEELRKMGGVPKEVLANEELLDFFEPVLRSDIRAVEDYQYVSLENKFEIPLHVCAGTEEVDITEEKLSSWQKETTRALSMRLIPGDHFFIFEHCAKIAELMADAYKASTITIAKK
jgi:surfactin synthase thioesterase subunit